MSKHLVYFYILQYLICKKYNHTGKNKTENWGCFFFNKNFSKTAVTLNIDLTLAALSKAKTG